MTNHPTPRWWTDDYTSAWDRVKEAFRRDWEQTKHDWGAGGRDLKQDVPDTLGQAAGTRPVPPPHQPNYEEDEPAARFGYGARRYYGNRYPQWNNELEATLRQDWESVRYDQDWDRARRAIRRGWDYID
jgi:hypothetical protein